MTVLATACPVIELTEQTIKVWYEFLKDITKHKLEKSVRRFCLTEKNIYPGTNLVAIIRSYALEPETLSALEAWYIVRNGISRRVRPVLNEDVLQETIDLFGWENLLHLDKPSEKMETFIRYYNELKKQEHERLILEGES